MYKTIVFIAIMVCASLVFIVISKKERQDLESHDNQDKNDDYEDDDYENDNS